MIAAGLLVFFHRVIYNLSSMTEAKRARESQSRWKHCRSGLSVNQARTVGNQFFKIFLPCWDTKWRVKHVGGCWGVGYAVLPSVEFTSLLSLSPSPLGLLPSGLFWLLLCCGGGRGGKSPSVLGTALHENKTRDHYFLPPSLPQPAVPHALQPLLFSEWQKLLVLK